LSAETAATPVRPRKDWQDWLAQVAYVTFRLFLRNELQNHAAAISFYFLLSVAPIILLLLYAANVLTLVPQLAESAPYLTVALFQMLNLGQLKALGLLPDQMRAAAGGVGLVTLLLASRGLLQALQSAFRVIFADGRRSFYSAWLISLLAMPMAFLLIVLMMMGQRLLVFFSEMELLGPLLASNLEVAGGLFAFAMVWLLIFAAYYRLPLHRPPMRDTALASLLASLSIGVLKTGFGYFVRLENYQAIYGTLGTVVFTLIWVYAVALVFLAWAQALYAIGKVDVLGLEKIFLAAGGQVANRAERLLFTRSERLLRKYGRSYKAGETIIREGEESQETYFLYTGRVALYKDIHQGKPAYLTTLNEGQLFGEMAYLLGEHRTATVTAETDVFLFAFPPEILEELMALSPSLSRDIVASLADRLKRMNVAAEGAR
jgi:membrane protein